MEPYRSTLATTALAVLGLVAAAHVLHPGNFEDHPRPARVAVATVDAPAPAVVWVDPAPQRPSSSKPTPSADVAALLEPRISVALPRDVVMAQPLAGALIPPPARAPRTEEKPRRRAARRAERARTAAGVTSAVPSAPEGAGERAGDRSVERQVRADPIGDLLRGLGLGRDG